MDKLLVVEPERMGFIRNQGSNPVLAPSMSDSSQGFPHCPFGSDKESLPRPLDNKARIANSFRPGAGRDKFGDCL